MSREFKWRFYDHKRDREAVLRLHHQMEERVGRKLDLPDLGKGRPVIATVVRECNGELTHGMFLEVEAEACVIGGKPLPRTEAKRAEELLLPVLKFYDIRIVRSFIPSKLLVPNQEGRPAPIGRLAKAMQFTDDSENMRHFFRWIEGE